MFTPLPETLHRVDHDLKRLKRGEFVLAGDVALLLLARLARTQAQRDMVISVLAKKEKPLV